MRFVCGEATGRRWRATSVTSHPFGSDDLISGVADNRRQLAAKRANLNNGML